MKKFLTPLFLVVFLALSVPTHAEGLPAQLEAQFGPAEATRILDAISAADAAHPSAPYDILAVPAAAQGSAISSTSYLFFLRPHGDFPATAQVSGALELLADDDEIAIAGMTLPPQTVSFTGGHPAPLTLDDPAGGLTFSTNPWQAFTAVFTLTITPEGGEPLILLDEAPLPLPGAPATPALKGELP